MNEDIYDDMLAAGGNSSEFGRSVCIGKDFEDEIHVDDDTYTVRIQTFNHYGDLTNVVHLGPHEVAALADRMADVYMIHRGAPAAECVGKEKPKAFDHLEIPAFLRKQAE